MTIPPEERWKMFCLSMHGENGSNVMKAMATFSFFALLEQVSDEQFERCLSHILKIKQSTV